MLDRQPVLSRRTRAIVSFFIIGHCLAVMLPPLAFQTRGPRGLSPSIAMLLWPIERYAELLYLNRGYAFFAPDPGPSHLVRVTPTDSETPDSEKPDSETSNTEEKPAIAPEVFPNLDQQWPRLKYHRYFMISEFLHDSYQPQLAAEAGALVGPDLPVEELQQWRLARKRYDTLVESIENHWAKRLSQPDVTLTRLEHTLPDFVGFTDRGIPISDPRGYLELIDESIDLQTVLDAAAAPVEPVPAPEAETAPETELETAPESENSKPKLKTDAFLEVEPVTQ